MTTTPHGSVKSSVADKIKEIADVALSNANVSTLGLEDEKEDPKETADFIISVMLLATSVVYGSVVYLVNSRNQELRAFTWSVLESACSIFIAVMLSEALKDLIYLLWRPRVNGFFAPQLFAACVSSVIAQVATWSLVSIKGTTRRGLSARLVATRAYTGVICRFCAFAWITFWSTLQTKKSTDCEQCHLALRPWLLVLAAAQMGICMVIFDALRKFYVHRDGVVDEEEAQWIKLTLDNDTDATGLCLSFLLSQWVRFWIGGRLPDAAGVESAATDAVANGDHTWLEVAGLFTAAVLFRLLGDLVFNEHTAIVDRVFQGEKAKRVATHFFVLVINICTKESGWLLLFTVNWCVQKAHLFRMTMIGSGASPRQQSFTNDCVQARAIIAVICSYLAILIILFLGKTPVSWTGSLKKGTLQSLMITVGFAWRRCFGLCIDNVTEHVGPVLFTTDTLMEDGELILEILVAFLMASILLPALHEQIAPQTILATDATVRKELQRRRRLQMRASCESLEMGHLQSIEARPHLERPRSTAHF